MLMAQSFSSIATQSNHALGTVKGLGPKKVVSLLDAFNKPFVASRKPPDALASAPSAIADPEPIQEDLPPTPPTPARPADDGPSRSPSVGPDEEREATDAVWQDPLGDGSDEDSAEEEPAPKRPRV